MCDGIIGYYGSRIRDYVNIKPVCPTLLFFAREDSISMEDIEKLKHKDNIELYIVEAKHGFMDMFSSHYDLQESKFAQKITNQFLNKYSHERE